MTEDRRKLQRKYLTFFGRIFDRYNGQYIGNVADITVEGAMVISDHPIPTEKTFQLRLDLPEHIFGIDHLDLEGHSIWCQPDIDPEFYNTGFQLLNNSPEAIKIIEQINQEYDIRG